MLAHFFTLETLARSLREGFVGARVTEAFTQSRRELTVAVEGPDGEARSLVFSVVPSLNALFARDGASRARKNSADVFPRLTGAAITGIRVVPFGRTVVVDAGALRLTARLFNTAASNVFLSEGDGPALESFLGRETRSDAAGDAETAAVDAARPAPPGLPTAAEIDAAAGRSASNVDRLLKEICAWLGPLYRAEICFLAGLQGGAPAASAGGEKSAAVARALDAMLRALDDPDPALYALDGAPGGTPALPGGKQDRVLSVVALGQPGASRISGCRDVNEGVREEYAARRREAELDEAKSELAADVERERAKAARSLEAARRRAAEPTGAAELRAAGTLILMRIGEVRKGDREARLRDERGEEVTVKLDRSLTPAANADAYFDRARKAETAREENEARIAVLAGRLASLERLAAEIAESRDARAVREIRNRLKGGRGPVEPRGGERLPYRIIPIGDRYEAWVGRSGADNDALTFRHAGPHDYWMHVRGSPGSHVVLRSVSGGRIDPPREVLRAAAKIAAFYSRMKNAGTVPVAWCERKYVRKPKNAPPGTVSLQREEIIFVEPGLP